VQIYCFIGVDLEISHPIEVHCFQASGKDPAYGLTGVMLLLAAVTILRENDKMPGR
jgi:hypothetical protein